MYYTSWHDNSVTIATIVRVLYYLLSHISRSQFYTPSFVWFDQLVYYCRYFLSADYLTCQLWYLTVWWSCQLVLTDQTNRLNWLWNLFWNWQSSWRNTKRYIQCIMSSFRWRKRILSSCAAETISTISNQSPPSPSCGARGWEMWRGDKEGVW